MGVGTMGVGTMPDNHGELTRDDRQRGQSAAAAAAGWQCRLGREAEEAGHEGEEAAGRVCLHVPIIGTALQDRT